MSSDLPLTALIEEDVRRQLCGGNLLLRIRLSCNEVASLKEPPPLFYLASRLAYVPLLFNDVYEHFKTCLPPRLGQAYEIWFDYDGTALKWHYPVGVLCDLLVGSEAPMPLDLTVHFQGGDASRDLLPFAGIGDMQKAVMSAFRQAVFLQHGSAAPFMRLPNQHQTQLWDSIAKSDLEAFSKIQRQLLCPSLAKCKSLSIRLHLYGPPHMTLLHPAPPLEDEEGAPPCSLRGFLRKAIPPLLDAHGALREGVEIITHGVSVPLDTPLFWLALNAAYLDHFVHLIARVPPGLLGTGADSNCGGFIEEPTL